MKLERKKIAKNTIWLFLRMLIMVVISLYTSRVILQALGKSDFGIYNVVGGIIMMMSFITGSLSQGIQRFSNFFLARNDEKNLNKIFSASYVILGVVALMVVFLGETLGLWFLNYKMNIPADRMWVANWIYQFSIITTILGIYASPLNGLIAAHEDFGSFAKFSIIDAIVKLLIAFCVVSSEVDKLFLYSVLLFLASFYTPIILTVYCRKHYKECYFSFHQDVPIYKELCVFSGWNLLGTSSNVLSIYGINLIINIFFGTIVNAARGIANQIMTQVDNLINNVQLAMNPQIQQKYSVGDREGLMALLIDNFKWNLMIFWIVCLPLFLECDNLLSLWLGDVPDYTAIFTRLILVRCMLKCFERPLNTYLFAIGKTKVINIGASILLYLVVLMTYVFFNMGMPVYVCYYLDLIAIFSVILLLLYYISKQAFFDYKIFLQTVISPMILTIVISVIFISGAIQFLEIKSGLIHLILTCLLSLIINLPLFYIFFLDKNTKKKIMTKIKDFCMR